MSCFVPYDTTTFTTFVDYDESCHSFYVLWCYIWRSTLFAEIYGVDVKVALLWPSPPRRNIIQTSSTSSGGQSSRPINRFKSKGQVVSHGHATKSIPLYKNYTQLFRTAVPVRGTHDLKLESDLICFRTASAVKRDQTGRHLTEY